MKAFRVLTVLLAICMLLCGCKDSNQPSASQPTAAAEIPSGDEIQMQTLERNGVRFTLPSDFYDYSDSPIGQGHSFLYGNDSMGIIGDETAKEDAGVASLMEFAEATAAQYGTKAVQKDGFWTVSYEDPEANETQSILCVFYETEDSFWIIHTYCPAQILDSCQEDMWHYATAAEFL